MEKALRLMSLFVFVLASGYAHARVVTGKVTSAEDQLGLPGVNVIVQGTTRGTATDTDGNYSISVESGETALVFTFVGYKSTSIEIGSRTNIDVVLEPDITS